MFEYLMPLLVTRQHANTLLSETYYSCVESQREYCRERSVPWGISESAYNVMDLGLTYQYRAFGVPGLGLKTGLAGDLVIAPYATALAALIEPKESVDNLRMLETEGASGQYGYYDSIDYTPSHVPPGRRCVVVKTFMAHHQGMTLVALSNVLGGLAMQRRFHQNPRVRASELMLQERLPIAGPLVELQGAELTVHMGDPDLDAVDRVSLGAVARGHLLGHGDLATFVTADGEGFTSWKDLDVTRFREDGALAAGGIYVYLQDRSTKRTWSAGYQPTRVEPEHYDACFSIDSVETATWRPSWRWSSRPSTLPKCAASPSPTTAKARERSRSRPTAKSCWPREGATLLTGRSAASSWKRRCSLVDARSWLDDAHDRHPSRRRGSFKSSYRTLTIGDRSNSSPHAPSSSGVGARPTIRREWSGRSVGT